MHIQTEDIFRKSNINTFGVYGTSLKGKKNSVSNEVEEVRSGLMKFKNLFKRKYKTSDEGKEVS